MASMASAARDIPQGSSRDNLTAVAARSVPVTRSHALPTPPNSISPALPPHGLKAQLQKAKLDPIDSDLDLRDADAERVGSPTYDAAGTPITPALLARDYLPEILLNDGPLPIRCIMGYLTSALPGFATVPPAKARRLVVGALEGRGSGGEGGGKDGGVVFEKVGWGQWDARKRGQPPRQLSSPVAACAPGVPISARSWPSGRPSLAASSLGVEPAALSHDDRELSMMDHEADKMSLDGRASVSPSCSEEENVVVGDDPDDETDDEDWAAVGAAALRAASYQVAKAAMMSAANHPPPSSHVHTSNVGHSPSLSTGDLSKVARQALLLTGSGASAALERASDPQELEAVEALIRLSSV